MGFDLGCVIMCGCVYVHLLYYACEYTAYGNVLFVTSSLYTAMMHTRPRLQLLSNMSVFQSNNNNNKNNKNNNNNNVIIIIIIIIIIA